MTSFLRLYCNALHSLFFQIHLDICTLSIRSHGFSTCLEYSSFCQHMSIIQLMFLLHSTLLHVYFSITIHLLTTKLWCKEIQIEPEYGSHSSVSLNHLLMVLFLMSMNRQLFPYGNCFCGSKKDWGSWYRWQCRNHILDCDTLILKINSVSYKVGHC